MSSMNKSRFLRRAWILTTILLLAIIFFFTIAQLMTFWIGRYRPQIEQYASQQLGMRIKIDHLRAGWYYFEPVIHLSTLTIQDKNQHPFLKIDDAAIGIDLFSSLWHWSIRPGVLIVSHADIRLSPELFTSKSSFSFDSLSPVILAPKKVVLKDVNIRWTNFKISALSLKMKKRKNIYHVEDQFFFQFNAATQSSHVISSIDFSEKWTGNFFVSVDNVNVAEWQKNIMTFMPDAFSDVELKQGKAEIQWWGDFKQRHLTNWQTKWKLEDLQINYPAWFNTVLLFSEVQVKLNWHKKKNQTQINMEQLLIENSLISVNGVGELQWEKEIADAVIHLTSQFSLQNLAAIKQYLPDKIMNEKLKVWLHQSIVAGNKTTGKMVLEGALKDFPFDNGGIFLIDSYWDKFTLDYKQGWPAGKLMNAHVVFKNRELVADIDNGTIDHLPLTQVKATISGLGLDKTILTIQGHLKTDAANARHFILNSPLKTNLDFFQTMGLSGPGIFDIDIVIPFYGHNNNVVNGKVVFLDNDFVLEKWWNLTFQHFNGWLTYNQSGIVDSQLKASLYHYPLSLKMQSVKTPKPATTVSIQGRLGIEALKKIFHVFVFDFMKGIASYEANLILTAAKNDHDSLTLHSNLQDVSIDLPKPYGKTALQKIPLTLLLEFSDNSDTRLDIRYADSLSLYLGYDKLNQTYHFKRGKIHLGGIDTARSTENGLKIEGSLPTFSLAEWKPFLIKMLSKDKTISENKESVGDVLESVQLNIPEININGQVLNQADILLSPEKSQWMLHIKSDQMVGNIQIPKSIQSGIVADLDYLAINATKDNGISSLQPKDVPPLNIYIKNVQYKEMTFNQVQLVTIQDEKNNALTIQQLTGRLPASVFTMQGSWIIDKGESRSQLNGYLSSNNLQKTLAGLGIDPVVQGKQGLLNFDLNWPDSLTQFKTADLNGAMNLKIEKGVITHLDKATEEKIGLGKLLNLLSLQSLAKHLTLDFSDLSEKGLSFEVLKGSFVLNHGKMDTNDTYLDGSVADITMKGRIDLGQKTYDLILNVAPYATSSIPVIATIAGGPIVGLAALAADTIITQGMKHTSMYSYHVIGPWKNPKVESLDSKKRKH